MIRRRARGDESGQTLVLFALVLVALMAIAGLAVDVANVYAQLRFYRATADAASLAGAQDLQGITRTVQSADYQKARTDALTSLVAQLDAGGSLACDATSDVNDCVLDGSPFHVSVKTPAPTCQTGGCSVDYLHSLQVTVRQPNFGLTFARILGISSYSPGVTSVAGLAFSSKYALVTLQPPDNKPNGTDANLTKDLVVSGNNTVLDIPQGDVGSNTSATTTLQGCIKVAAGYNIEHYDDLTGTIPGWLPDACASPLPTDRKIASLILDPNYMYPAFTGCTSGSTCYFSTQTAGVVSCSDPAWKAYFPTDYATLLPSATTTCYLPGVYADNQPFSVGQNTSAYLMPGAYYFPSGMTVNGTLAGGLITGVRGVALQFDESNTKTFSATSSQNVLLNAGSSTCSDDSCRAKPAIDFATQPVQTPQGLLLTIEVTRDANCFSGLTPQLCKSDLSNNRTVNMQGNGLLTVGGVIYGPSDNMQINANNTTQTGVVGQVISYSVKYAGGATLKQSYPGGIQVGVVRLDAACTAPSTPCTP